MEIVETLISFNYDHEPTFVNTYEYNSVDDYIKTFEDVDYKIKVISGGFIIETLHCADYQISMISIRHENKIETSEIYDSILHELKSSNGSVVEE